MNHTKWKCVGVGGGGCFCTCGVFKAREKYHSFSVRRRKEFLNFMKYFTVNRDKALAWSKPYIGFFFFTKKKHRCTTEPRSLFVVKSSRLLFFCQRTLARVLVAGICFLRIILHTAYTRIITRLLLNAQSWKSPERQPIPHGYFANNMPQLKARYKRLFPSKNKNKIINCERSARNVFFFDTMKFPPGNWGTNKKLWLKELFFAKSQFRLEFQIFMFAPK